MSHRPMRLAPLSAQVQRALARDPLLYDEPIVVFVDQGRVRLVGVVSRAPLKERATAVAITVPGVRGVSNELDVV